MQFLFFLYFIVAFVNDVFEVFKIHQSKIKQFQNFFYTSIIFPSSMFVCITFWVIYSIDKTLLIYEEISAIQPIQILHLCHTFPIICVFIEMLIVPRHYHPTRLLSVLPINTIVIIYWIWQIIARHYNQCWTYPMFNYMNNVHIFFFVIANMLNVTFYQWIGEKINNLLHKSSSLEL